MDKYTYSMKAEKIQKLVKKGDYEAAVKIADTVDWEEVHSVRLLTITAAAYENTRDYRSATQLLQMAYEESAVGKRILYKLTGLAIADQNVELAQHYYEMYLQEASDDNGRYLLRYLLAEMKKEPLDKRIAILETYRKYEFEEEWALRLAQMYDEAGMGEQCVKLCDEIILWFGVGDYVDEAMALKEKYAPLSALQQEHRDNREAYARRYQEVVDEYNEREAIPEEKDDEEVGKEEEPMESWPAQILLINATNLEKAVPKALEHLSQYYRTQGKPMRKLTRISAERFNQIGFDAAQEHTRGKDLLIDEAGAISEGLLADIVHSLKYDNSEQVFVLADNAEQLAYLDSRLTDFIAREEVLPQIEVSEMRAEDVLIKMSETVEGELEEASKSVSANEVSQKASVLVPFEEEMEQLSFNFDLETEVQGEDWALAAGASPSEESVPLMQTSKEMTPENSNCEEFQENKEIASNEEPEGVNEIIEKVECKAEVSENPFSFSDFLLDQSAALFATAKTDTITEDANESVTDKTEAAVANDEKEDEKESVFDSMLDKIHLDFEPQKTDQPLSETEFKADTDIKTATKELPVSEIRDSMETKSAGFDDGKTTVVTDVRKAVPSSDAVNLEGATKVVNKIEKTESRTGSLSAIGMDEDGFVTYAKNYLISIDCVLDEAGEVALQNAAEARKEKGVLLTKEEAENMIEEAADMSERKGGLFGKRYNKEGYLILKGKFIK